MEKVETDSIQVKPGMTEPRLPLGDGAEVMVGSEVVVLRRTNPESQNQNGTQSNLPSDGHLDPQSPVDPSHKPSYLKLSCAVSGYGKYSRYSTYVNKDPNRLTPYSSQSSLLSEGVNSGLPSEPTSGAASPGSEAPNSPSLNSNGYTSKPKYPTGDTQKDGEYFLQTTQFEEDRIKGQSMRAETYLRAGDVPEDACGKIRSAIGKANLLTSQKFEQFRELCHAHMTIPSPGERETKWEDLQGFWDMVKIQVDQLDTWFAEIQLMRDSGWQEVVPPMSRRSSASSTSPKSANPSQASTPASTPAATPGARRRGLKGAGKDTPDSSPERSQKARQAAKQRDEQRRKMLAQKRAAMKKAANKGGGSGGGDAGGAGVEIYVPDPPKPATAGQ